MSLYIQIRRISAEKDENENDREGEKDEYDRERQTAIKMMDDIGDIEDMTLNKQKRSQKGL